MTRSPAGDGGLLSDRSRPAALVGHGRHRNGSTAQPVLPPADDFAIFGRNVGKRFWGRPMAQEHCSGQIVPESGVYRVTHASAHAGALLQVRLIKGRRFPACPYCQEISFELAHSDEAFWRDRSAPGTRYRRHRRSARSQSRNKAVVARSRAVVRFVGWARWSAMLGAIVIAVRGLLALRG
jgi:hypothetical protein